MLIVYWSGSNLGGRLHAATNGALTREGVSLKVTAATIAAAIGSYVLSLHLAVYETHHFM